MQASDVTATLDLALGAAGLDQARVMHRPRLLSDNGPSYVASDLADWLANRGMTHIRGAPCHPQTQGKIERWHQTLKNRILLEHAYLPGELESAGGSLRRALQSLPERTRASAISRPPTSTSDAAKGILAERDRIKRQTLMDRRLRHHAQAA